MSWGFLPGHHGEEEISLNTLASKETMLAKICGVEAWMLMNMTLYSRSYVIFLGNDYQWQRSSVFFLFIFSHIHGKKLRYISKHLSNSSRTFIQMTVKRGREAFYMGRQ